MLQYTDRETGAVRTFSNETEFEAHKKQVLANWYVAAREAQEAKTVIEKEQSLRKEVAALFFLDPKEGVNTLELTEGYKLKLTYKIDRKVDEAALDGVKQQLRDLQVNPDPLIVMKPSLDTKVYKGLVLANPEAAKVFEQALTIKPASSTLEIVAPKS